MTDSRNALREVKIEIHQIKGYELYLFFHD